MKVKDYLSTLKNSKIFGEDIKEVEELLKGKEEEEVTITTFENAMINKGDKKLC